MKALSTHLSTGDLRAYLDDVTARDRLQPMHIDFSPKDDESVPQDTIVDEAFKLL